MDLLIIGSSILVALGIKGLRALAVNYKYKQTLPKDELITFTKKVVKGAKENGQGERVNLPEWEKAIINKIKVLRQKLWMALISLFPKKYTIALKFSKFLNPLALDLAS